MTNRKFQSRLTLSAYNSASKALNLKKYHIFGIPRTSAFTWYPPRYMMQHQNFEKLTKYKKMQNFVIFHCRPPPFMSEAAALTILTLRTLDIAHFEAETRSFSGVWYPPNWGHLKKFGSHTRPKLCNWDSLPPKQLFLGLLFGFKHFFHLVRPNLPPPMIYIVGKLWILALIWHRAIEI